MWPLQTAPLDRPITLIAIRLVPGLGPVEEAPFAAVAKFYPEHGFWAAEDQPPKGMPSLGLIPLDPAGWIC